MIPMNMPMSSSKGPMMMNMTMPPMAMHHGGGRRMWMWFHTHLNDTALFESWWIHGAGKMVWSCIVVAILGIMLEAIRWVRWLIVQHSKRPNSWLSVYTSGPHLLDTTLFIGQIALSNCLMLFFMTYSLWICWSLCLGLAIGHYVFGTRRISTR